MIGGRNQAASSSAPQRGPSDARQHRVIGEDAPIWLGALSAAMGFSLAVAASFVGFVVAPQAQRRTPAPI